MYLSLLLNRDHAAHFEGEKLVLADYDAESAELRADLEILMGDRSLHGSYQQIATLDLRKNGPIDITGNCQSDNSNESLDKLFDNNYSTKWYSGTSAHIDINPYDIYWAYVGPLSFGFILHFFLFILNDDDGRSLYSC
jgi:hypothetical protein